jgi:hypothetical protein
MDIGGSCGSGGPYDIAQECPDGAAAMLSVAFPLLTAASLAAVFFGAPRLLLVMWVLLFGSLGWNFFEFAIADDIVIGWLVCGVAFWMLAIPGLLMLVKGSMRVAPSFDGTDRTISDPTIALIATPCLLIGSGLGLLTFFAWG